jgi:hypothetical protein
MNGAGHRVVLLRRGPCAPVLQTAARTVGEPSAFWLWLTAELGDRTPRRPESITFPTGRGTGLCVRLSVPRG